MAAAASWRPGQRVTTYQLGDSGYQWYAGTVLEDHRPETADGRPAAAGEEAYNAAGLWNCFSVLWDAPGGGADAGSSGAGPCSAAGASAAAAAAVTAVTAAAAAAAAGDPGPSSAGAGMLAAVAGASSDGAGTSAASAAAGGDPEPDIQDVSPWELFAVGTREEDVAREAPCLSAQQVGCGAGRLL